MMEGWSLCRLEELCTYITDGAHHSPKTVENGLPMASVKDMSNFGFNYENCRLINEVDYLKLKKGNNQPKNNDILIAKDGSYLKHCFVYKDEPKEVVLLSSIAIFRPDLNKIIPSFLAYLFKSPYVKGMARNYVSGVAIPRIVLSDFKKLKLNLPPLKTQRKIASILSAYDDLIENNLKRIKLLEEQAQQTYTEWFVRFKFPGHETANFNEETGLPEGWDIKKLNEISKINSKSLKKDFEGGIEYIDIASVSVGNINSTTCYEISNAPGRAKRIVRHGDIIWSCVRPNRKSHAVIWKPKENLIASTGFCVITPKSIPTSYLLKYVTTDSFVAYLTNLAGGAAYPAVKAIDFKDADVVIPTKDILNQFDNKFKKSLEVTNNLQNQNQLLKEARDILLPRLMSGMIDVEQLEIGEVLGMVAEESVRYKKS